jgi:hypothetical protein
MNVHLSEAVIESLEFCTDGMGTKC